MSVPIIALGTQEISSNSLVDLNPEEAEETPRVLMRSRITVTARVITATNTDVHGLRARQLFKTFLCISLFDPNDSLSQVLQGF